MGLTVNAVIVDMRDMLMALLIVAVLVFLTVLGYLLRGVKGVV